MITRRAWLVFLPFVFLPDMGLTGNSRFGDVGLSDLLVCVYVALLLISPALSHRAALWHGFGALLLTFAAWALIATLSIPIRLTQIRPDAIQVGMVKLGKLCVYGLAGYLTLRAIRGSKLSIQSYTTALMVIIVLVGVASWLSADADREAFRHGTRHLSATRLGYGAGNSISVMLGALLALALGLFTQRETFNTKSRWLLWLGIAPVLLGFASTNGRSGWICFLGAMAYVAYRRGLSWRYWVFVVLAATVTLSIKTNDEVFDQQLASIVISRPQAGPAAMATEQIGLDDGARIEIFLAQMRLVAQNPFAGAGLFHRGLRVTGLYTTGSHNFWLQMFLELGCVGGVLALLAFFFAWQRARRAPTEVSIAVTASLLVLFFGNMSGEYLYGGLPLLAWFLCLGAAIAAENVVAKPAPRLVRSPEKPALHMPTGLSGQALEAYLRRYPE